MAIILTDTAVRRLINEELDKRGFATKQQIEEVKTQLAGIKQYDDTQIKLTLEEVKTQANDAVTNAQNAREETYALRQSIQLLAAQFDSIDLSKLDADTIDGLHIEEVTVEEYKALEDQAKLDGTAFPQSNVVYIIVD